MRITKTLEKFISLSICTAIVTVFMTMAQVSAENQKFNMSYLYFGNSNTFIKYVDNTKGALQTVSPSYFDINAYGDIDMQKIDSYFIKEMHNRNIRVVPFVSNHWNQLAGENALKNREFLAEQIAYAVNHYNLDGINIDIEGLTHKNRHDFTDFIRLLRSKIPGHKEVSVAVAANPYRWTTGWQGMYDYNQLALYSNYLMIMAYDESWEGGNPGSVASISFVEKSIQYALEQNVPANKIVLGIPFYGRVWNLDDIKNQSKPASEKVVGKGLSLSKINSLLSTYNARVEYITDKDTAKAVFTIKNGDPAFRLNSWDKPLSTGTYELWYENEQTIRKKLELVQKYNLKGTGSWSLGQENRDIWDNYSLWLNGKYFKDIENHWAKEAIMAIREKGWISGTSSTHFSPDQSLSRAQAAVLLVRVLGLAPVDSTTSSFEDVQNSYWAKNEIEAAKHYGIISGVGGNKFAPESFMTREQMAMLLYKVLGEGNFEPSNITFFEDVSPQRWSYQAVLEMNRQGIFIGYPDGRFKPEDIISRAQMAALMYKVSGIIQFAPYYLYRAGY